MPPARALHGAQSDRQAHEMQTRSSSLGEIHSRYPGCRVWELKDKNTSRSRTLQVKNGVFGDCMCFKS